MEDSRSSLSLSLSLLLALFVRNVESITSELIPRSEIVLRPEQKLARRTLNMEN